VLELPYGIEGFAFPKNLVKEDGPVAEAGESLDFKVVEFSKEDRKIILSHTNVYTDPKEDASKADKFTKKKPGAVAGGAPPVAKPADANKKEEVKSTLGDLEALSALREQMQNNEKEQGTKKLQAAADAKSAATDTPSETTTNADAE
jgi:small subunit ribosomal protein S1